MYIFWFLVDLSISNSFAPVTTIKRKIPYGTVPFQFRTGPVQTEWIRTIVNPISNGSEHIRSCVEVALSREDRKHIVAKTLFKLSRYALVFT